MISFVLQGDYEMVISDYGRAKSLFAGTDIKIFKRGVLSNYSYLIECLVHPAHSMESTCLECI